MNDKTSIFFSSFFLDFSCSVESYCTLCKWNTSLNFVTYFICYYFLLLLHLLLLLKKETEARFNWIKSAKKLIRVEPYSCYSWNNSKAVINHFLKTRQWSARYFSCNEVLNKLNPVQRYLSFLQVKLPSSGIFLHLRR